MNQYRDILIKGILVITAIIIIFSSLSRLLLGNSDTLAEYAEKNPELAYQESVTPAPDTLPTPDAYHKEETTNASDSTPNPSQAPSPQPTEDPKTLIQKQFYYAPLTEEQIDYITGCSYPDTTEELAISYDDLSYLHILHYDFEGNLAEGELICNVAIAQDLMEIFYELYLNEYQLEKVTLIENYGGDDTLSMEDNNTSCFNYRVIDGTKKLSKHAYGLAVDINPFYNPYVTYPNGGIRISPAGSEPYADRAADFPYKIDENDLCYKLFIKHGFTWGGNWNSSKDYQHFQKTLP